MELWNTKAIINFLEAEHVLSAHQFGFRRRLGADDLLTALQHHWATTAGNGDSIHVPDIAGAFDKVSHRGVLHRASTSDIVGPLHRWLTSYLCDRTLRVVTGGQQSSLFPIEAGVRGNLFRSGNLFPFGNVRVHRIFEHRALAHLRPVHYCTANRGSCKCFSCKITYFLTPQFDSSSLDLALALFCVVQGVVLILRLPGVV